MPTIPVDTGPQVAPAELQGGENTNQVTPGETGAAIAEGIQKVGAGATDVAMAMKQKVDTIQSLNADTALGSQINDALWGPQGVTSAKGETAAARMAQATQDVQAKQKQIADGLTNESQRIEFMQASKQRLEWFQRIGGNHVAQQTEQANQDAYTAQIKLAASNATGVIANHGVDSMTAPLIAHEMQAVRDATTHQGNSLGWKPDELEFHMRQNMTQMTDDVVSTMLAGGHVAEAKGFYDAHADEMIQGANGSDPIRDKVNAAVQTQMIGHKVGAAMDASRVMETPGELSGGGIVTRIMQGQGSSPIPPTPRLSDEVDGSKAYAALLQDPELKANPQLMTKAVDQLTARLHVQAEQQRADDNAAASPLMAEVEQSRGIIGEDLSAKLQGVRPSVRAAVIARAKEVANPPATDMVASASIHAWITANPEKFASMTPLELNNMVSGYLDPADRSDVVKSWQEAGKAMKKGDPPGSVMTKQQAIDAVFKQMDIDESTKSGATRIYNARKALDDWSQGQAKATGNAPNPTQLHDQLMKIVQQQPPVRPPVDAPGFDVLADPERRAAWADAYAAKQPPLQDAPGTFAPRGTQQALADRAKAYGMDYHAMPAEFQARLQHWWGVGAQGAKAKNPAMIAQANQQIQAVFTDYGKQRIDRTTLGN